MGRRGRDKDPIAFARSISVACLESVAHSPSLSIAVEPTISATVSVLLGTLRRREESVATLVRQLRAMFTRLLLDRFHPRRLQVRLHKFIMPLKSPPFHTLTPHRRIPW